ncbi:hypothetical protein H2198_003628 [Neophaeococcomyces mojaviensis]|uniref:Uncharacterized protein n=1 Tax=Neophaeococcomyces mojaviensis TaxID=3383035 RepID=A0ACC3AAZ3_9EURO|nr:hypothetical protein H2198_003628 [Knufia sp. JES_112]
MANPRSSPLAAMSSPATSSTSSPVVPQRQSVRDLLAQLSDSDSDINRLARSKAPGLSSVQIGREGESSESDVLVGGGRLARRLAGEAAAPVAVKAVEKSTKKSPARISHLSESEDELVRSPAVGSPEHKDEAVFQPKRQLLLKRRKQQVEEPSQALEGRSRSLSPAESPSSNRSNKSPPNNAYVSPVTLSYNDVVEPASKPRFSALVEKARAQRLAREEVERAKKQARQAQESVSSPQVRRQRGSSPADDSEEDSDRSQVVAAKRLAKDARPTRKASKKALEEMNRETQRMNRNMQLAHQARTKKKFTKERFFASFNNILPSVVEASGPQQHTASSSTLSSDTEHGRRNGTPPTSPLPIPDHDKTTYARTDPNASVEAVMAANCQLDDLPSVEDILAARRTEDHESTLAAELHQKPVPTVANDTLSRARMVSSTPARNDSSSDSDLEVIADKASKRKYSAFENLPKKKLQEKPSHLALRSLANLKHERDAKSVMSKADMGPALLRAARKQAQEERQAKIEKLKAAGVVIVTAEEREKEEEELEDLVEKARQEDEEIRKREKEMAKKDGTFQKDILDEDSSDGDDDDFQDDHADDEGTDSDSEEDEVELEEEDDENAQEATDEVKYDLIDEAAEESADEAISERKSVTEPEFEGEKTARITTPIVNRTQRRKRIIDDEDDEEDNYAPVKAVQSPALPSAKKTPQSIIRSARKVIPGLQHSDDLSIGLTQAFAATMADSQMQEEDSTQGQDSIDILRDLPSPNISMMPGLTRFDSIDMISESVPGSQTQPLGLSFGFSQSQRVPDSPAVTTRYAASQAPFDLTQDTGYKFSPFAGNRFAETPKRDPHSTEETTHLDQIQESPIVQRKGRLQRGRQSSEGAENVTMSEAKSAFRIMNKAAKRKAIADFNKKKSEARQAIDEAAEESDDEYAGLGGVSDEDSDDEANEEDRNMIDEDTQIGKGDEAKLAKLHADRERESDEAAVSKLLKDITTGALRRKRGAGDDLDLSDEEDAAAQRRKAKQREFEKMRRALLKDEAIGKIAEDKKKEAFLKSIEDRDDAVESDDDFDQPESDPNGDSQSQSQSQLATDEATAVGDIQATIQSRSAPLQPTKISQLNKLSSHRPKAASSRKPATLAEIRESVSYLIEEPDSQAGVIDLGLSDSEDEPEAYVNLDRHLQQAEADENAEEDDAEDLGDFVVDDQSEDSHSQETTFKKPELPSSRERDRAPFSERRTKALNIVDRLSLLRQASSSTGGSNPTSKMAFFTSTAGSGGLNSGPSLLRRATTNSSLGSMSGRETVSATGVVTSKTERGSAKEEKEFVRKGNTTSRNAVNYQGRQNLKEEKMSARAGVMKKQQQNKKGGNGFLNGLLRGDTWG